MQAGRRITNIVRGCLMAGIAVAFVSHAAAVFAQTFTDQFEYAEPGEKSSIRINQADIFSEEIEGGKHIYRYKKRDLGNAVLTVETWKLISLRFGGQREYNAAEREFRRGDYPKTLELAEPLTSQSSPWWLAAHAQYLKGQAQLALNKNDAALETFQGLAEKQSQSRFTAEALYTVAQIHFASGRFTEASAALKSLSALNETYGPGWSSKSQSLAADIKFMQKDYTGAAQIYRDIASSLEDKIGNDPELRQVYADAMLKTGTCHIESGKLDTALKHYEDMKSSPVETVKAGGYLGSGNVQLKEEKYRSAALDFLRVLYLYKNQTDFHHDAAFGAGKCYALLFKLEAQSSDAEKAKKLAVWLFVNGDEQRGRDILKIRDSK